MTIKFYSWWTPIAPRQSTADTIQRFMNKATQDLTDELNTVLGDNKLISMTSAATDGIVVTTIAYEEEEYKEHIDEKDLPSTLVLR